MYNADVSTAKSILKFFNFKDLPNWSTYSIFSRAISFGKTYDFVPVSEILKRTRREIIIDDETEYKRVTIKLFGKGVKIRDTAFGKDIGTKRQFIAKAGDFLLSKIDARNGAFGLANEAIDGAIITNDFPAYTVNTNNVLSGYFELITHTQAFLEFCRSASSGSTGRQRVDEQALLNCRVPLPSKDVQRKLVDAYQLAMNEANEAERRAAELEKSIEEYLLDELGIEIIRNEIPKGLQFVNYKDVKRWSIEALLGEEIEVVKNKKYPLVKVGSLCTSKSGGTPAKGNKKYWNGSIPWVSPKDMKTDFIVSAEDNITEAAIKSSSAPLVRRGSILIVVRSGILQRVLPIAVNFKQVSINQDMRAFKLTNNDISLQYLFFYFKYSQIDVLKMVKNSTTVQSIDSNNIDEFEVPLPSKQIQKIIVKEIKSRREQIKTLRETAKAKREQAKAEFENALFEI